MQHRNNRLAVNCSESATCNRWWETPRLLAVALCIGLILAFSACDAPHDRAETETPVIETRADSVAYQLNEALGGFEAWRELPYLRFDFTVESGEGDQNVVARHYWDRQSDDYRVEWYPGEDTTLVALFNVQEHEQGTVYQDGDEIAEDDLIDTAYSRFINDSYWALAPVKTFDDGVTREYIADSSDAQHEVIRLSFGDVGLTPGDQYWLYVNSETHQLDRWAFVLERAPDSSPSYFEWLEYEQLDTPAGPVFVSTRKQSEGGQSAILTPVYELSDAEREGLLDDTAPRLH